MKLVNRISVFVLAIMFLLSGCTASATESVEVRDAWARTAAQGENEAVYLVIRSSEEDAITGVFSDVAEAAEIHESMINGDVMEMHHVESVPLGAGKDVTFEPGGLHVMLVRLNQDLKVGDEIEVTLQFKNHEDLAVRVAVKDTP